MEKPKFIEDLGMQYPTIKSKRTFRYGLYECPYCGKTFKCQQTSIKNGNTKSCGCHSYLFQKEWYHTHNLSNTKLYRIWAGIKSRCNNKKSSGYKYYGGKGIIVCQEWQNDFLSFYNWAMENGYEKGLEIDRIENDKGYSPDNCRCTTSSVNKANRSKFKCNKAEYKCVYKYTNSSGYFVSIMHEGKQYCKSVKTPLEGAIWYNNWIIEHNTNHEFIPL